MIRLPAFRPRLLEMYGEYTAARLRTDIQVRCVRQRPAPEPSERKHDELAVGDAAVRGDEFGDRGIGKHL